MRCLKPRTVGYKSDGKTICWKLNQYNKQYPTFQLPCSNCIECRLEYARQWAVRCIHEAKMHEDNSFITLTYDVDNLPTDGKLQYEDFQLFMKRLRKQRQSQYEKENGILFNHLPKEEREHHQKNIEIGMFTVGEYGEKTKRPHFHAILFNWRPRDAKHKYTTERQDKVYESDTLTKLWTHGTADFGSVTFESAGYVARYSSKKLVHGHDDLHDLHPISKKSQKHAIGKKFLEKYYKDIFNNGWILLPNGEKCQIPRYYEKWLEKHHPETYREYLLEIKLPNQIKGEKKADEKAFKEYIAYKKRRIEKGGKPSFTPPISRNQVRKKIVEKKFKQLTDHLKL